MQEVLARLVAPGREGEPVDACASFGHGAGGHRVLLRLERPGGSILRRAKQVVKLQSYQS